MDFVAAQQLVQEERARWWPGARGRSDTEMLRGRERLFNAAALGLGLACLPAYFFGGVLRLGAWGSIFLVLVLAYAARRCSTHANQCRDARGLLEGSTGGQSCGTQ